MYQKQIILTNMNVKKIDKHKLLVEKGFET